MLLLFLLLRNMQMGHRLLLLLVLLLAGYMLLLTMLDEALLRWCCLQHLVLLGGPGSEWLPLEFGSGPRGSGGGVVLVEEVDGLRVLTKTTSELIQRAAAATESVFGVGSCDPPAMLCYALERLYAQDAAAEESLRAIKPDLGPGCCCCYCCYCYCCFRLLLLR